MKKSVSIYKGRIPEDLNNGSVYALYLAEFIKRIADFCFKKRSERLFKLVQLQIWIP